MRLATAPTPDAITSPADPAGAADAEAVSTAPGVPAGVLGLSATALGCALQVNFGQYHPLALLWLCVALACVGLCLAKPGAPAVRAIERRRVPLLGACLGVQFALLLARSPGATGALAGAVGLAPFRIGVLVAGVLCAVGLCAGGRRRLLCLVGLLVTHALLGAWVLNVAPDPGVDVALFQRGAAEVLADGGNPYAMSFDDPYPDSRASPFYGPGVSSGGRLWFGYPYPPLGLLFTTPAHLLGDFRLAHLACMTAAGALIALARPGRIAFAAAALLLFTPRGFFVLEAGWTEPLAVLCLAATVFAACRAPRALPVALGLLLASKQYLVLSLLVVPLLGRTRRTWPPLAGKALAVAAVVTLPLALWDLSAFWHSAVALQFRQPFREDSLSFLVPLAGLAGGRPPAWVAFALAAAAGVTAVRRMAVGPAAFAAALAATFLVFFAFSKQAFCNYYYFVVAALCCAAAAGSCSADRRAPAGRGG